MKQSSLPKAHKPSIRRRLAPAVVAAALCAALQAPAAHAAQPSATIEQDLQKYWSVEQELPVVTQRLYSRDGRMALGLVAGLLSSEPFQWYIPVGLRAGYNFSEASGVELSFAYMDATAQDTELTEFLSDKRGDAFNLNRDAATDDQFQWRLNAVYSWSPFYGKFAFLQRKLSHFQFNLAAGLGVVSVNRPALDRNAAESTIAPEAVLGGGVHLFLTRDLLLQLDGRAYVYQSAPYKDANDQEVNPVAVPAEFLIGLSYLF